MRTTLWNVLKWFLFRLDAETAHRITISLIKVGVRLGNVPLRLLCSTPRSPIITITEALGSVPEVSVPRVLGMSFLSRVGLAAGFDKDAEILQGLPVLGFGFAEIGTVTPVSQLGHDRPRLFRDLSRQSLFNRMGFNGLGAKVVAERLLRARPGLPKHFRVGVNLGKNRDTPMEQASQDYVKAAVPFKGLADYVVINVSSPNTLGLRSLQTLEALKPIVEGVNEVISGWNQRPPLLLKLAPELAGEALLELIHPAERWGIDGWVLTNTRAGTLGNGRFKDLTGGWSGKILASEALARLKEARTATSLPIISVGGIFSVEEAITRREAGADLIQIYSSWIFNGPSFPSEISKNLK